MVIFYVKPQQTYMFLLLYWPHIPAWVMASSMRFVTVNFSGLGRELHTQPPTWRTRDYTLIYVAWVALPGAYAPACIVLRIIEPRIFSPR
jgi:hypothetical protein